MDSGHTHERVNHGEGISVCLLQPFLAPLNELNSRQRTLKLIEIAAIGASKQWRWSKKTKSLRR